MAKDDYDVIVYKILLYLYACLKRKIVSEPRSFHKTVGDVNKEYLEDIYRFMQKDGLIEGLVFHKPWQNAYILINDESDMNITSDGIKYLKENDKMKEVGNAIYKGAGFTASLIAQVGIELTKLYIG